MTQDSHKGMLMCTASYLLRYWIAMLVILSGLAAGTSWGTETMRKTPFGKLDGQPVDLYTLTNTSGMEVAISNYGGIIVSIKVPDRNGKLLDIVLGFDTLDGYLQKHPYFGATIGRYANRIHFGRVVLDGVEYSLTRNENENHLHGGLRGFDKVLWNASITSGSKEPALMLQYLSKDGEEGYPGNLHVTVTFALTEANELKIDYRATTDKPTIVNLTNHSYFNLAGAGNGDVLGHLLMIDADRIAPVIEGHIPTGDLRPVHGTPFDFTKPVVIGQRIDADDELLKLSAGYGVNYVFNKPIGKLARAARVVEPASGRVMEIFTTEPALQLYTANRLDGRMVGKDGKAYKCRYGLCLEPQHLPDSPNQPQFPSTVLRPGQLYHNTTIYKFCNCPRQP